MLEPGFELGHYRIIRSLGSGGMADVYEAEDIRIGRRVALKVLPPELTRNSDLIERFEKEVRAAAALSHPGIVTLFEFGHEPPYHYYTMQLLPGGDLRERMRESMSLTEVMKAIRGVAEAFNHAHKRGFVHRDVKPENILFDEEGTAVLTDFGIAKAIDSQTRMTKTGMSVGTPRYISPEQIRGKDVDGRADLYALGCILYEMFSGEPPYDAPDTMAIVFKHVSEPIPTLPPQFQQLQPLLNSLMAKDPDDRCPDAKTLIEQIDQMFPRDWTGKIQHLETAADLPGAMTQVHPSADTEIDARMAASAPTEEVENIPAQEESPGPERLTALLETPLSGVPHSDASEVAPPPEPEPEPEPAPVLPSPSPEPVIPPPEPRQPPPSPTPEPALSRDVEREATPRRPASKRVPVGTTKPERQRKGPWLALAASAVVIVGAVVVWGPFGQGPSVPAVPPEQLVEDKAAAEPEQAVASVSAESEPPETRPVTVEPAPSPQPTAVAVQAQKPAPAKARPTPAPTAAPAPVVRPTAPPVRQAKAAPPEPRVTPVPEAVLQARREAKAQGLFEKAQKTQRQGDAESAKQLYTQILKDYQNTRVAEPARQAISAIEARERKAREQALAARRLQERKASAAELFAAAERLEARDDLSSARGKYAEVVENFADLSQADIARQRIDAIDQEVARRAEVRAAEAAPPEEEKQDEPEVFIGF